MSSSAVIYVTPSHVGIDESHEQVCGEAVDVSVQPTGGRALTGCGPPWSPTTIIRQASHNFSEAVLASAIGAPVVVRGHGSHVTV